MRVLNDTLFLAAPTFRSRAYAQAMVRAGLLPARVLALPGTEPHWAGAEHLSIALEGVGEMRFSPGETAVSTMVAHGVPIDIATAGDVNNESFVNQLSRCAEPVVIYSGMGGVIVRAAALGCGKRFLHVHGGWAPEYRGSTAFYYSMLEEGRIGATALWLSEVLDAGPVLARRKYRPAHGVEIDRIQDPLVRADLLISVLRDRVQLGFYPDGAPGDEEGRTFFVVHPVLKHIALRQSGNIRMS